MQLPQGCGEVSGKVAQLTRCLYGFRQMSELGYNHLVSHMKGLRFEQCLASACIMYLYQMRACFHGNNITCGWYICVQEGE